MANQRVPLALPSIAAVLVLAIVAIAYAQAADPKPKPTGSISGRVTIDGKAVAGLTVAAVLGESVNRRDAAGRAVSDAEGRFRISGLAAGQYQLWALAPGMVAEPETTPNYYPYLGAVKSVIVTPNEDAADVNLKLLRGAVITGRITTAEDKPVVDERITLQLLDANGNLRLGAVGSPSDQMFTTDDRGIYRIFGLSPGRYKVSVGIDPNEGFTRGSRIKKTFYPETSDESKATIVELKEADEARNIDIKVQNGPPGYVVSGRVIDTATGLPMARAGIRFSLVQDRQGAPPATFGMQSDERGEFNFTGISPGRYSAYATSESYGGNFYGDPVSFEIVDKDVTGVVLKTIPGLSLSGIVVSEGLSIKELLTLVPGLRIDARGTSTNNQFNSGGQSVIAPDGSFQVDGLRPGRISIFVSISGAFAGARPTIDRIEHAGIGLSQGFDIQQSVSGLRVMINYGTGTIRGRVSFEGEVSISDFRVMVTCLREGAREPVRTQVDARGVFLIKNLAPGNYQVMAQVLANPSSPFRPILPPKQVINVANNGEAEATFVVRVQPKQGGP